MSTKTKYVIEENGVDFWGNKKYSIKEESVQNIFDLGIGILLLLLVFGLLLFYKFLLFKYVTKNRDKNSIGENTQNKIDLYSFLLFISHIMFFLPVLIMGNTLSNDKWKIVLFIYFMSVLIPTFMGLFVGIKRRGNFNFFS